MTPVFQIGGAGSTPAGCLKIGKLWVQGWAIILTFLNVERKEKNSDKKSDKKYAKVCGCDEYGREAWLMVSQHRDTDKVEVLSSEEGEPVVYTKSQISELIKELKKYVK